MTVPSATTPLATTYALFQELAPFDAGWKPFPHHYLLYAASGTFHVEVALVRWLLPPQRAAWIAAHVPIHIMSRTPVTCCSIIFAPTFLSLPVQDCRVFTMSSLARHMIHYAMRWGADRDTTDSAADRFFRVLADVCLELATQPDQFWLPRAQSPELHHALSYTLQHLADDLLFADVARAVAVSERTLARRFATELHMTWRQFTHRARMIHATELLAESQASVIEVAYATGFASVSAFTSAFRHFIGLTPRQFRAQHTEPTSL
jgi:transcriptional regulator GlxA family with amidase domain